MLKAASWTQASRNLRHLGAWFAIVLAGALAWWATGTPWGIAVALIAGPAGFYFIQRRD